MGNSGDSRMADLVAVVILKDKIFSPFCSATVLAVIPGPAPHGHNVAAVAPSFSFSENITPGQEERTVLCLLLRGRKSSPEVPQQTVLHASISIPVVTGHLL